MKIKLREGKKTQQTNARNLITIRYRTMVPDGEGGHIESWFDRRYVWAEIAPFWAKQRFEYKSINVHATHHIKILGKLDFQTNTKRVNDSWEIIWSGISGSNVKIEYEIVTTPGVWTEIIASTPNDGSYIWTIPAGIVDERIRVKITSLTDSESLLYTIPYNIVAVDAVGGLPQEHDQILWTVNNKTRTFEILAVENIQERNIQAIITCNEMRD